MKLLYTVILAIALMVLLRGANYFLTLATRKKKIREYTLRVFPWIEVALWASYVFWVIHYWFYDSASYAVLSSTVAIVFILLVSWYVLRDILAGAVLRSDHSLETGLQIKTDILSGTISYLGFLSMEITTPEGERITVPYSRFNGQSITKKAAKGQGRNQSFKIVIPQHHGALNIEKRLKQKILELPWVIAEGEIKINMKTQEENYVTEISFYSIKEEMLNQTEEIIRKYVSETFKSVKGT